MLRDADGNPLPGTRKVLVEVQGTKAFRQKASLANGQTSMEMEFVNGEADIPVTPEAGETSVQLKLTEIASGATANISVAVASSAPAPQPAPTPEQGTVGHATSSLPFSPNEEESMTVKALENAPNVSVRVELVGNTTGGGGIKQDNGSLTNALDKSFHDAVEYAFVNIVTGPNAGNMAFKITFDASDGDTSNGITEPVAELYSVVSAPASSSTNYDLAGTAHMPAVISIPAGGELKIIDGPGQPFSIDLCGDPSNSPEHGVCNYSLESGAGLTLEHGIQPTVVTEFHTRYDPFLLLKVPAGTPPGDYPATIKVDSNWRDLGTSSPTGRATLAITPTIRVTQ